MAAEFQGAGKAVGLEVWRIEKLSTVKLAEVRIYVYSTSHCFSQL